MVQRWYSVAGHVRNTGISNKLRVFAQVSGYVIVYDGFGVLKYCNCLDYSYTPCVIDVTLFLSCTVLWSRLPKRLDIWEHFFTLCPNYLLYYLGSFLDFLRFSGKMFITLQLNSPASGCLQLPSHVTWLVSSINCPSNRFVTVILVPQIARVEPVLCNSLCSAGEKTCCCFAQVSTVVTATT
jgi:hypothetical protein